MKYLLDLLQDPFVKPWIYVLVFVWGAVFGSFLNVLILRVPKKENIKSSSHCMACGHKLAWYDNIPLFSWILLGGKCRYCKTKISIQYPIIEALNGLLCLFVFIVNGINVDSILICAMSSALLSLSVVDWRTFEIHNGYHWFIGALALFRIAVDYTNWSTYIIGFFAVSVPLAIIYFVSGGRAIGGGDVKLMAVCGLFLGWQKIILALALGCVLGSIIHLTRMKISKDTSKVLAMGPYLSMGIFIASLYGTQILTWYLSFFNK